MSQKTDTIIAQWMEAVQQDEQIEITAELTYKAILDSLPKVLEAMATLLSHADAASDTSLILASLEHGIVRADQGFEPTEIAREYRILRSVIFATLEPELIQGNPAEILRAVRLIDTLLDEAIAQCFSSYTQGRLRELEQLQGQLKLTNQELTRLVRTSKANLSQLAHELKTPLTSIIGYSDLFLRQQRQGSDLKDSVPNLENVERVLRAGRQLLRLINDALELSRYDAGRLTAQPTVVDVRALLISVVEMVEPLAHAKQLLIHLECDRAPQQVSTDALRLQQILTNLLSNAVRYTNVGSIHVICQLESEQTWSVTVQDSGVGIAPDDQQRIFEPYVQVGSEESAANRQEGTGLGLAIVARLVELLQGTIQVTSQVNHGTTFVVRLPLRFAESSATP